MLHFRHFLWWWYCHRSFLQPVNHKCHPFHVINDRSATLVNFVSGYRMLCFFAFELVHNFLKWYVFAVRYETCTNYKALSVWWTRSTVCILEMGRSSADAEVYGPSLVHSLVVYCGIAVVMLQTCPLMWHQSTFLHSLNLCFW